MKKIFFSVLFLLSMQITFAQQKPIVKNAVNGIFIFCGKEIPQTNHYKIERKANGDNDFKFVAEIYFPNSLQEFSGKINTWNGQCRFYEHPTDEKIRQSFALFQTHNSIDSIFYFNSNPLYLYASGNAFLDMNVEDGKTYIYKISYNGNSQTSDVINFQKTKLNAKAKIATKQVWGTYVQLKWFVKQTDKNNPPHVMKVFRSDNLQTPLREMPLQNGFQFKHDSLFALVNDTIVAKKYYYSYCIQLLDKFGNESLMSDTVSILNKYANTLPVVHLNTRSNQNKKGIELVWRFEKTKNMRSIDVYRSNNFDGKFTLIHSALPADTSFVDHNVKPITSYFYYIQLNGLYEMSTKSATISGMYKTEHVPLPPQQLQAKLIGKKIHLTWQRLDPSTRGYYVYKGLNYHPKTMLQVSNVLITDSLNVSFDDSSDLRYGKIYSYCVKAVSDNYVIGKSSDTVGLACTSLDKNFDLAAPSDVWVAQINKAAKIVWPKATNVDLVSGYELLRREISEKNFSQKSNWITIADEKKLQAHTSYLDTSVQYFKQYEYAVKSHYNKSVSELSISTIFALQYDKPLPPLTLKATRQGTTILLDWDKTEQINVVAYKIYRDENGKMNFISKIEASKNSFQDKNIIATKEYSYRISCVDKNGVESNLSTAVLVEGK